MNLDPRRLRFLLAIARTGGVLAAADELGVTASAVSQQINRLEHETGHTLIQRTSTGSLLTPAGLALAETAEDIERALALARSRLEQDDAELTGTVRVGGFQSFLASILAPALPDWRGRYPGLRFETVEAEEDVLMRELRAGTVDALVVELDVGAGYTQPRGATDLPLLDEPWKLVVPYGSVLATDMVDLTRLALPWLSVDPNAAGAKAIQRVSRLLGGETSTAHTYYSFANALALIAAGEGITLVPSLALEGLRLQGVDALDVPGLGMRRIVLRTLSRARRPSPTLDTAISLIREAAASFDFQPSGSWA